MNKKQLLKKLADSGIEKNIIYAFDKVEREKFVPENLQKYAYEDIALPIGHGQTISQPYTIAFMLSLLDYKPKHKILEVGSGSGYVLSLLNAMGYNNQIYGTEIIEDLYERSTQRLETHKNIKIHKAKETLGLPEQSFDRILVSAAAEEIPETLVKQLKNDGVMVCPIQNSIMKITKFNGDIKTETHQGFVFVRLVT